jgi:hypothetical protein
MIGHLIREKQPHPHDFLGRKSCIQERDGYYSCAGLQKAVGGRGGGGRGCEVPAARVGDEV